MNAIEPKSRAALTNEAEDTGKWLWTSYQDLWFSPAELRKANLEGSFCWGPESFRLRDPNERLHELDTRIRALQNERAAFERRMSTGTPSDPKDPLDEPLLRVACAAIRHSSGVVIAGVRHYDSIMREVISTLFDGDTHAARVCNWYACEQGFLTNKCEFLTREQAWPIAERAGQIRPHPSVTPGRLHSEDLY